MAEVDNQDQELRDRLRALPRTNRRDSRYPIDAYEDDLVRLLKHESLKARIAENERLTDSTFVANGLLLPEVSYHVDGIAKQRIVELEAELKEIEGGSNE